VPNLGVPYPNKEAATTTTTTTTSKVTSKSYEARQNKAMHPKGGDSFVPGGIWAHSPKTERG
jgi:hypothetical protein